MPAVDLDLGGFEDLRQARASVHADGVSEVITRPIGNKIIMLDRTRHLVHGADAVEILVQPGRFTADDGLLLLDVVVDAAVGIHLLDVLHAAERALDGVEIREGTTEPAFGDVVLVARLGRFFHGFLDFAVQGLHVQVNFDGFNGRQGEVHLLQLNFHGLQVKGCRLQQIQCLF